MAPHTSGPFTVFSGEVHTGVFVGAGDLVSVTGTGVVDVGSFFRGGLINPVIGPEGFPYWTPPSDWPAPDPSLTPYSLVWKIGSSTWFQGGTPLAPVSASGEIILAINDAWPSDNSRGWDVIVKVDSPDPPPRRRGEPTLRITFVEAIQIIQRSDNSVPLVEGKRTMLRVFIDSGMRDGSDLGQGPNRQPNVMGTITLTQAGSRSRIVLTPDNFDSMVTARPMETIDRTDLTHSLNFTLTADQTRVTSFDVRVFVRGHEADTRGGFVAFYNRPITLRARQPQELRPILLQDTQLGLGPPTIGDYGATLVGAIARYPIADNGFVVHAPLVLPAVVDLTQLPSWNMLVFLLATMILYFPSRPGMEGIRTALVPNDGRYALNGIGMAGYFLTSPTFVARTGLQATFAHEMAHCFSIGHASCPPPGTSGAPQGLDTRLPAVTEDVGISMQSAAPALIPPGQGELMSYCGGQSRWPSISFINTVLDMNPI